MNKENVVPFIRKRPRLIGEIAVPSVRKEGKHRYARKVARRQAADWARELGLDIAAIEMSPDGTIRVLGTRAFPQTPANDFDRFESEL